MPHLTLNKFLYFIVVSLHVDLKRFSSPIHLSLGWKLLKMFIVIILDKNKISYFTTTKPGVVVGVT